MIYGSFKEIQDNNISKILYIMRYFKIVFLPSNSGLRQPIHAYQLAEVIYFLMMKSIKAKTKVIKLINLGGDNILNYEQIIESLRNSVDKNDPARKCIILKIPNRIFLVSILPIMIFSPKYFASLSRICSNLASFQKACEIIKTKPRSFPFSNDFN